MISEKLGRVNVSVANIYGNATYQSEIVTQSILNEKLEVMDSDNKFSLVRLQDGYQGWISNYQWVTSGGSAYEGKKIRSHFIRIYDKPDTRSRPMRDATIGTILPILDQKNSWFQVILPDTNQGWVESRHFGSFPPPTRAGVIELAYEFLGYPYYWGGRTVKGFDCSGFVQTIFAFVGIDLPRDAWMQHRDGRTVKADETKGQAGDLYFFAEGGTKVTHVGLGLGDGQIIHSRGMVRINSLTDDKPDYSQELATTFFGIKTFL